MILATFAMSSMAIVLSISALLQSLENRRRIDESQAARNYLERLRLEGHCTHGYMR